MTLYVTIFFDKIINQFTSLRDEIFVSVHKSVEKKYPNDYRDITVNCLEYLLNTMLFKLFEEIFENYVFKLTFLNVRPQVGKILPLLCGFLSCSKKRF